MADLVYEEQVFLDGEVHEQDGSMLPGTSHEFKKEEDGPRKREDDDEVEEEEVVGQIIQGEDGEFYVVMEDDGGEDDVDVDNLNNIEVQVNEDGSETLVLESNMPDPRTGPPRKSQRGRAVITNTGNGPVEVIQFVDDDDDDDGEDDGMAVGAMATAEAHDAMGSAIMRPHHPIHMVNHNGHLLMEPLPQGHKLRRNRVYGTCRCPDCGQSFVNTARLERHLAVHQVFGSYMCPLCGKTYKYEYNLFYHWRRTCRDLNDLMSLDDRKTMDVNALRGLVDEVAAKKAEYGPIEIGISRSVLFQSGPLARLEMPTNPLGRRGSMCRACGVMVHQAHLDRHMKLHRGDSNAQPDERSQVGGFYCDLCGLMFRQHYNLIKHWRSNCAEIQANLPSNVELTLDDGQLRAMVMDLLKRASTNDAIVEEETRRMKGGNVKLENRGMYSSVEARSRNEQIDVENGELEDPLEEEEVMMGGRASGGAERDRERDATRERERDEGNFDEEMGPSYLDEQGAVFADDFEDDEMLLISSATAEEGVGSETNRAKWSMAGGPIQCEECFRTFANTGRLERHMAGFHASFGSHHCALCGNRFKYDYNLLYHYRRSCPYTKTFIDRDVREQMDAINLRKLVRTLAQKEIRLAPMTRPALRLPKPAVSTAANNDAMIRREMLKPVLNKPAALLQQPRPGMKGAHCPVCSVIFYSDLAMTRHCSLVHNLEYEERDQDQEVYVDEEPIASQHQQQSRNDRKRVSGKAGASAMPEEDDEEDAPPVLEAQPPGEEARVPSPVREEEDEEGKERRPAARFLQDSILRGVNEADARRVQEMIDSGVLSIEDGDNIIFMDDDEEFDGIGNELEVEVVTGSPRQTQHIVQRTQQTEMIERRGVKQPGRLTHAPPPPPPPPHARGRVARASQSSAGAPAALGQGTSRKRPHSPQERSVWDEDYLDDVDDDLEEEIVVQEETTVHRTTRAGRR